MAGVAADTAELDQLTEGIRAAVAQLAELDPANTEAGRRVITAARPPRDTGRMAAGMTARDTPGGVTFASTAPYWVFVHWGAPRRNVRARPYFIESIEANRAELVAVYLEHVRTALSRI